MQRVRARAIIEIDSCPVLAASMDGALAAVRALARALAASGKPLDILVTATASGLDVDLKGHGPLGEAETQTLVRLALAHDLARLSNRGSIMISRRTPMLAMGKAIVAPPPGVFLQATDARAGPTIPSCVSGCLRWRGNAAGSAITACSSSCAWRVLS